jgi:hypothetical protein
LRRASFLVNFHLMLVLSRLVRRFQALA